MGPELRRRLSQALYEAVTIGARFPALALFVARWRGHGVPLSPATDILIEGYPRSGNSFAVAALAAGQPEPLRIAHHLHAPGHVIAAVRAGVPALVVIRHPSEAVPAFVLTKPFITIRQALRGYVRFYGPLLPHRERFVVATFEEVTTDFGTVTRRVNERFGTSFKEFEHTEAEAQAVFGAIDRSWEERAGPGLPLVGRARAQQRPNPSDVEQSVQAEYEGLDPRFRARAERLYRSLDSRGD